MARRRGGKDLHQLGDKCASQRAARDDRGQLDPQGAALRCEDQPRHQVRCSDADNRGEPHQRAQRGLKVHCCGIAVSRRHDARVDRVGQSRSQNHGDTHGEHPHQQRCLKNGVIDGQDNERHQSHACHTVGFKTISGRSHRVACIIARAVSDNTGVARVVLVNFEHDLHQIRADVGNLCEDAAGYTQGRGSQRLTDGEADETGTGNVIGQEQQDDQHHQQFEGNEDHSNRHAGLHGDSMDRQRLAPQGGVGGARVGERVDADTEPRHGVGASHSQKRKCDHNEHLPPREADQNLVVDDDNCGDEDPQNQQETSLFLQVGLACCVDQLRDLQHGAVYRHLLELYVGGEAESQSKQADDQADNQQSLSRKSTDDSDL